jgi:hypothetical protein
MVWITSPIYTLHIHFVEKKGESGVPGFRGAGEHIAMFLHERHHDCFPSRGRIV